MDLLAYVALGVFVIGWGVLLYRFIKVVSAGRDKDEE